MSYETDRLILRQWRAEDYEPFAQINADPITMRYFPSSLSVAESNANADKISELLENRGWGFWAVEIPGVAPFIGFVGLHIPMDSLPFSPCVEIGWRLDKHYWGNGYASEAARFALEFGFTELKLKEIVSFTSVLNKPSQAVMERIGMHFRNETFEHPSVPLSNPLRKHVLYRLSREEWRQQLNRL